MAFALKKTNTITRDVPVVQYDESGKEIAGKIKIRFKVLTRAQWDELTKASDDDERLLFDVVVDGVADEVTGEGGAVLSAEDALAAIRSDLNLSGQIVSHYTQFAFGAAAKNAQRSRAR